VRVDPGAVDPEPPRQLRRVDQLALVQSPLFQQLDHAAGDCLNGFGVELDTWGCHLIPLSAGGRDCLTNLSSTEQVFGA
jgi:hypothetical protein